MCFRAQVRGCLPCSSDLISEEASVDDNDLNASERWADEILTRQGQKHVIAAIRPAQNGLDWKWLFLSGLGISLYLCAISLLLGSREPASPILLCLKTLLLSTTGGSQLSAKDYLE